MRSAGREIANSALSGKKRVERLARDKQKRPARGFDYNLQSVECVKLNLLGASQRIGGPRDHPVYSWPRLFHLTSAD
jgi:hypothetical protein